MSISDEKYGSFEIKVSARRTPKSRASGDSVLDLDSLSNSLDVKRFRTLLEDERSEFSKLDMEAIRPQERDEVSKAIPLEYEEADHPLSSPLPAGVLNIEKEKMKAEEVTVPETFSSLDLRERENNIHLLENSLLDIASIEIPGERSVQGEVAKEAQTAPISESLESQKATKAANRDLKELSKNRTNEVRRKTVGG